MVNQDNQPPGSIPSTLIPSEKCPQCKQVMALPPRGSGQAVCLQCEGSNGAVDSDSELPDEAVETDLLHLLEQAASESLKNMKPRKKRS